MIKEHSQGAFSSLLFKHFAVCGIDQLAENLAGTPITNVQLVFGNKPPSEEATQALDLLGTQTFWLVFEVGGIESPVSNIDVLPAAKVHKYLKVNAGSNWEPIPIQDQTKEGFFLKKAKSEGEQNFLECSKYDLNNYFDWNPKTEEGLVLVIERDPKSLAPLSDLKLVTLKSKNLDSIQQSTLPKGFSGFLHLEIATQASRRVIAFSRVRTPKDSFCLSKVLDVYPEIKANARQKVLDILPEVN